MLKLTEMTQARMYLFAIDLNTCPRISLPVRLVGVFMTP